MRVNIRPNWPRRVPWRVACIGECMIELAPGPDGALQQGFAGDTLNFAVYLRRLTSHTAFKVDYVTALGDDPFSHAMLDWWGAEELRTALVPSLEGMLPGLYWVETDAHGERRFHYWRSASAARQLLAGEAAGRVDAALADFDLVYLSAISVAILPPEDRQRLLDMLAAHARRGALIAFDSNFRSRLWKDPAEARRWHEKMQALTDLALVSFEDEASVFGDATPEAACSRLVKAGIGEVVVKNGPEACVVCAGGDLETVEPPAGTEALDTTAAGDAFNAAYVAARASGCDLRHAALIGHRLAALVVAHPGAMIPREGTPELEHLLGAGPAKAEKRGERDET